MRRLALLALLAGCSPDLGDLSEPSKPNREKFCTHKAHAESADGYYDNDIFLACMYGTVDRPDGGSHD